jgi:hypothetical protein
LIDLILTNPPNGLFPSLALARRLVAQAFLAPPESTRELPAHRRLQLGNRALISVDQRMSIPIQILEGYPHFHILTLKVR